MGDMWGTSVACGAEMRRARSSCQEPKLRLAQHGTAKRAAVLGIWVRQVRERGDASTLSCQQPAQKNRSKSRRLFVEEGFQ